MHSEFWTNTVWFFLLGLTSVFSISLILWKAPHRKFIVGFGFAVLGATFFAETALLTISNAYAYMPKLSKDPFLDSVIGNYFSQFSLVSTALLLIVYRLPLRWNIIFAGGYCLVEELFLKLGIYRHIWYQTWYTFVGALLLFWVVGRWHDHMSHAPKESIYYLTLFLGANAVFSITVIFLVYAFSFQVFHVSFVSALLKGFFRTQALLIVSYRAILILVMMILYHLKIKWGWKGAIFIFLGVVQYVLTKIGIFTFKNNWFFIVNPLLLCGSYFWVIVINNLLSTKPCRRQ